MKKGIKIPTYVGVTLDSDRTYLLEGYLTYASILAFYTRIVNSHYFLITDINVGKNIVLTIIFLYQIATNILYNTRKHTIPIAFR